MTDSKRPRMSEASSDSSWQFTELAAPTDVPEDKGFLAAVLRGGSFKASPSHTLPTLSPLGDSPQPTPESAQSPASPADCATRFAAAFSDAHGRTEPSF